MRSTFISSDGRAYGEPILAFMVILFYVIVGNNTITAWFGWWLFVISVLGIQSLAVSSVLVFIYGDEVVEKHYPAIFERNKCHRAFILTLCHSTYLFFWWKWSV